MFEGLSKRLGDVFDRLRGRGALSEADVDVALREVRTALLEADVALPVVRQFIDSVRPKAIGADVIRSVTPKSTWATDPISRNLREASRNSFCSSVKSKCMVPSHRHYFRGKPSARVARILRWISEVPPPIVKARAISTCLSHAP